MDKFSSMCERANTLQLQFKIKEKFKCINLTHIKCEIIYVTNVSKISDIILSFLNEFSEELKIQIYKFFIVC